MVYNFICPLSKDYGMSQSHDQNFKNLILDYPISAIQFFAPQEAKYLDQSVKIIPLRQEQLKLQLGSRYRELDTPLLLEWPDGRRQAIIFLLEEESITARFSISRYAHYCLDMYELYKTHRIVPVVIFLKGGNYPRELKLGSEDYIFLNFNFIACDLSTLDAEEYLESDNIVARLNLPLMCYNKEKKVDIYAHAVDGLIEIESELDQQLKYMDFIEQYAQLNLTEQQQYQSNYLDRDANGDKPMGLAQLLRDEVQKGREEGIQKGIQKGKKEGIQEGKLQGEADFFLRLLKKKFVTLPDDIETKINNANSEQLLKWSERLMTANNVDDVFH